MNPTWIIFKKELWDVLRDYKTLLTSILIPILLFPIIFFVTTKVQESKRNEAMTKAITVGVSHEGSVDRFLEILKGQDAVTVLDNVQRDDIQSLFDDESVDAIFLFSKDFQESVHANKTTGYVNLYFKFNIMDADQGRLTYAFDIYKKELIDERYAALGVNEDLLRVVELGKRNMSSIREVMGSAVGGFLPYIFLILAYVGCLAPAIDIGAGEKERGTLETLLVTPASRMQILMGKFWLVAFTGFISGALSLLGCFVSLQLFFDEMPRKFMKLVLEILSPETLLLIGSLLVPICILMAAVMLMISIYCRNYKECQSYLSPLMIAILFPAILAMIPGFELNGVTALIPVFNISLATKAIVAGNAVPLQLAECYLSMFLCAGLALVAARRWFGREQVLFRD
jgi:sodium transport system permease protein